MHSEHIVERRAVEEKALYSSHLTQILKEQEETKRMVQELRSELRSEMTHVSFHSQQIYSIYLIGMVKGRCMFSCSCF